MAHPKLNRQRFIFTPEEIARLPKGQPYIAYVCYNDWTDGDQSTLMHRHENLAEVLLILKGQGRYAVDLRQQEVMAGDIVLCNGGALHDEFPETETSFQTLCVGIGNLSLPGLPPHCLIGSNFNPLFHHAEQFEDLMQNFCQIDRHAAEREERYQTLCQLSAAHLFSGIGNILIRQASSQPDRRGEKKYRAYPQWAIRPGYLDR